VKARESGRGRGRRACTFEKVVLFFHHGAKRRLRIGVLFLTIIGLDGLASTMTMERGGGGACNYISIDTPIHPSVF
jgi:hypothetical protein